MFLQRGDRSPLTKVLAKDETCTRYIVLCVASITSSGDGSPVELELTDGWYGIRAVLDAPLSRYVSRGKIFVGLKLRICGAQMEGLSDGVAPLECACNAAEGHARPTLRLHANGTRRAAYVPMRAKQQLVKFTLLLFCADGSRS